MTTTGYSPQKFVPSLILFCCLERTTQGHQIVAIHTDRETTTNNSQLLLKYIVINNNKK